jgi:Putative adhesin
MKTLAAALALTLTLSTSAFAARQIIGSEQDHSLAGEATDCEHFYKTTFTNLPSQMSDQEQREIQLGGIEQLRVVASEEGGVSIRGWNRPYARLIVCRYAVANNKSKAIRLLGAITVSHEKGAIFASGPPQDATQAWWVNMILYVPRRASVDVRAANGGVAIRNMSGTVTAHATSGGISVAQSSGKYKISTNSGGITLERVTGTVDATSREGAIALKFAPNELPLVEAKIAEGGEILCQLQSCEGGLWGANRRQLRLGHGAPNYRLTTNAAPILIGPVTF